MLTKKSLIFVIEDDVSYGKLVEASLKKQGFENTIAFFDEENCLENVKQCPAVIISDYHLKIMTGLKLIQKAKEIYNGFYSILLSGAYHKERYDDEMDGRYVDKYIMKGHNDINKLLDVLNNQLEPNLGHQYY